MTITAVGEVAIGGALTSTVSANAAASGLAALALPEVAAKISGYTLLSVPSPTFDIGAQLTQAGVNLTADLVTVAAIPGIGPALAAAISAGIAAQATLRAANPALGARVDSSASAIGGLNVQVSAGVSGPNVNLVLNASILAQLEAYQASIAAQVALSATLGAQLGVSGLRLYRFDGDIGTAGAELQAQVTADGISGELHFVLMLPTNPAAWAALQATVKTS